MLRTDMNRIADYIKHTRRVLQLTPAINELPRGFMDMDSAGFVGSGYAFADNALVGTVMGFRVYRSAALADNHIDYLDPLGTTTYHSTILIAAAGAFTAVDQTYTEAGACGVFSAGGGELIHIDGSTVNGNNGTFLSTSATANTLVLAAIPGDSTAIVNEAAVATSVFI
ncbi:MAG: hypothetical protein MUO26_01860 [Methanotrichaceae archaeon]|nr:hypothetical protein [Methanotrichaceae archaeon]